MYYFTVFTPTYNRAYIISSLYKSLLQQTFRDFEWVIVDDGSTDETEKIIRSFIDEDKLNITYIKKENEGKHIAVNCGVMNAKGMWFFIVDSDDMLLKEALETAYLYCEQVADKNDYAGVVGLRCDSKGKIWDTCDVNKISARSQIDYEDESSKTVDYVDASAIEYRFKLGIEGDRAEIVKTEVMKKYPFPKFDGEKFVSERYLWHLLSAEGYKFRWFNKIIYVTEYLDDGLTKNSREREKKNCKARSYLDNLSMSIDKIPIRARFKYGINYLRYGRYSGQRYMKLLIDSKSKIITLFCLPIAIVKPLK